MNIDATGERCARKGGGWYGHQDYALAAEIVAARTPSLRCATESSPVAGFRLLTKKEHEKFIPEIAIAHGGE